MTKQKVTRKKEPNRLLTVIGLIILAIVLYFFPEAFKEKPSEKGLEAVELVKVIDGDTIKVHYEGETKNVRYLLIDTPETNHPELGEQPFGQEAKKRNAQLVEGKKIELEFDEGDREDKYGRLLAYIYADGVLVNEILVEEGLARVGYVFEPSTRHVKRFEKAQAVAEEKGIGIWSIDNYVTNRGFVTQN